MHLFGAINQCWIPGKPALSGGGEACTPGRPDLRQAWLISVGLPKTPETARGVLFVKMPVKPPSQVKLLCFGLWRIQAGAPFIEKPFVLEKVFSSIIIEQLCYWRSWFLDPTSRAGDNWIAVCRQSVTKS